MFLILFMRNVVGIIQYSVVGMLLNRTKKLASWNSKNKIQNFRLTFFLVFAGYDTFTGTKMVKPCNSCHRCFYRYHHVLSSSPIPATITVQFNAGPPKCNLDKVSPRFFLCFSFGSKWRGRYFDNHPTGSFDYFRATNIETACYIPFCS